MLTHRGLFGDVPCEVQVRAKVGVGGSRTFCALPLAYSESERRWRLLVDAAGALVEVSAASEPAALKAAVAMLVERFGVASREGLSAEIPPAHAAWPPALEITGTSARTSADGRIETLVNSSKSLSGALPGTGPACFLERHAAALSAGALLLGAFNLIFRLGDEFVSEWDESLYAISAWETSVHGGWIGTTFLGALDYYNTKPPLLVWLVALCFKVFGANLLSLRLVPVVSAWLTVAVLQHWLRRAIGPVVALLASVALSVTFGFIHIHAGRSAVTDAPFTLVLLLVVVTLWAEHAAPWRRVWLGPLIAGAFLLRGMGALMPLTLIGGVLLVRRGRQAPPWQASCAAVLLAVVPVAVWVTARYQVDEWAFLSPLFLYDLLDRTVQPLEGHVGGPFYYVNILLKHQYDLVLAAVLSLALVPVPWARVRTWLRAWRETGDLTALIGVWAAVTLLVPTLMQTKTAWYLNTFYPVFAVLVALVVRHGLRAGARVARPRARNWAVAVVCLLLAGFAEGRLWWYSMHYRDMNRSEQALLLDEASRLRGQRLLNATGHRASHFVAEALLGAVTVEQASLAAVLRDSREGDFGLLAGKCVAPAFETVRTNGSASLCQRRATGDKPR